MRPGWRNCALLLVLLTSVPQVGAQAITLTPLPVRSFGYSIGDRIERQVDIQAAAPWSLVQASLPTPGRQNAWFELAEVSFQPASPQGGAHDQLRLVYQLLNSPAQPTVLQLPRIALRFEGVGAEPVERDVPPADVFAAPLLPASASGSTLDTPRADRKPEPIAVDRFQNRLTAYALAAAFVLAWMLIARQLVQRRRAGPFVRACRELRRLAHSANTASQSTAAMRVVHRALDETAGRTVFLENVETLFASPHRGPLRERTTAFLSRSRQQFFAGMGEPPALEELRDLARAWRALEMAR
jgi:mxaA protein